MSALPTNSPRPLPPLLKIAGSVLAVGHLLIIGLYALSFQSGPWATPFGNLPADPPRFAGSVSMSFSSPFYLEPLRMTHNYHFASNRPPEFAVYFEVHLKNESGNVKTLKFPDDRANFWVRHRQEMLAQNLLPDQRVTPPGTRRVGAPKSDELPTVDVWLPDGEWAQQFDKVTEDHKVFKNNVITEPSPWAKVLVKSYLRYLCREHNAVSAELVRYSRSTVTPTDVITPMPRPETVNTMKSYFGESRRDQ